MIGLVVPGVLIDDVATHRQDPARLPRPWARMLAWGPELSRPAAASPASYDEYDVRVRPGRAAPAPAPRTGPSHADA